MDVRRLLSQTVTVTRVATDSTTVDDMGDPTTTTTTATFRGYVWQTSRSDETANTDVQTEDWRLVLERSAVGQIDGGDRVTVDGVEYEVDGPPWPALNPRTNRVEFIEADVRRSA